MLRSRTGLLKRRQRAKHAWHTKKVGNYAVQLEWSNKANKCIREANMPFGIQPIHLLIIVVFALIIFGPKRLPDIGRGLGRSLNEFRLGAREMTDGFREEVARAAEGAPATAAGVSVPSTGRHFCAACGTANETEAKFCQNCGGQLAAQTVAAG
jgi:TatA/E family protein of Tat protein translocase